MSLFCFMFSVFPEKAQVWVALSLLCHSVIHAFVLHHPTSLVLLYPIHSNWGSELSPLCTNTEDVTKRKCCMLSAGLSKTESMYTVRSYWCYSQAVKSQRFPTLADYLAPGIGFPSALGNTEVTLPLYTYLTCWCQICYDNLCYHLTPKPAIAKWCSSFHKFKDS